MSWNQQSGAGHSQGAAVYNQAKADASKGAAPARWHGRSPGYSQYSGHSSLNRDEQRKKRLEEKQQREQQRKQEEEKQQAEAEAEKLAAARASRQDDELSKQERGAMLAAMKTMRPAQGKKKQRVILRNVKEKL